MHEVGKTSSAPEMNTTQRTGTMQRWQVVQHALMLELRSEVVSLTPKLEKMVHTLGWMRIEEFIGLTWRGCERPEHDRGMLANALVSKAVLGLSTTTGLTKIVLQEARLPSIIARPAIPFYLRRPLSVAHDARIEYKNVRPFIPVVTEKLRRMSNGVCTVGPAWVLCARRVGLSFERIRRTRRATIRRL